MTLKASSLPLMAALLAAAATPPHYLLVDPADDAAADLKAHGFIEFNPEVVNPKNKKEQAARLTDAGNAEAVKANAPTGATTNGNGNGKPTFAIVDFALPKIERKGGGGNRKSKYPTDQLQPGQAFFIPVGDDVKSPSKTYGSIASSANKKYGSLAAGADFRYFETRSLADGAPFGDAFKGKKGIVVGRLSAAAAGEKRDALIVKANKPKTA